MSHFPRTIVRYSMPLPLPITHPHHELFYRLHPLSITRLFSTFPHFDSFLIHHHHNFFYSAVKYANPSLLSPLLTSFSSLLRPFTNSQWDSSSFFDHFIPTEKNNQKTTNNLSHLLHFRNGRISVEKIERKELLMFCHFDLLLRLFVHHRCIFIECHLPLPFPYTCNAFIVPPSSFQIGCDHKCIICILFVSRDGWIE